MSPTNEYRRRWKAEHPEAVSQSQHRYYSQVPSGEHSGAGWTVAELEKITAEDRPSDAELARRMGRSIKAIEVARTKVTHGVYTLHTDSSNRTGPRAGRRTNAPEILPTATSCPRCFCTHPGDC